MLTEPFSAPGSPGGRFAPRESDLFGAATREFDLIDPEIARYAGNGCVLEVRAANSLPRRMDVLNMRTAFYEPTLTRLGVSTWDAYDERAAVHLLCVEQGRPVGSIRVVHNAGEGTELHDDFGCPDDLVPRQGRPFVTFGRELVVPHRRGAGISLVLVHAACLWCRRYSEVDTLRVVSLCERAEAVQRLGVRPLTEVLPLGPGRVPVVVLDGEVSHVFELATRGLRAAGWSVAA